MDNINCLVGEMKNYALANPRPSPNSNFESMAPWVEVKLGPPGTPKITVGLESYPNNPHTAIVKSLEIGWVDTPQTVVQIIDEEGGRLGPLLNVTAKNLEGVGTGSEMSVQFGWIVSDCNGYSRKIRSNIFKTTILNVEVSYSGGKMIYKITGTAFVPIYDNMREDGRWGQDLGKITIEEAIRNICQLAPPITVRYVRLQPDGNIEDVKFNWKNFGPGGPKAVWQADNQNRIATITKWLEDYRLDDGTKEGKGIIPIFTPGKYDELCLLEDPDQNENFNPNNILGTYIVNGGNCSSVIEFSPTFNWLKGTANFSAGGGTSGPGSSKNNFSESKKNEPEKAHGTRGGKQQQITISQQAWDSYGPQNAWDETNTSQQAHARAARLTEVNVEAITADLRIVGDPTIWDGQGPNTGKTVSIIVINPFHLSGDGCGDWLVRPVCNQILSNKKWQVTGINHSIKEGSFVTTIRVYLPAVGIDLPEKDVTNGL